LKRSRRALLSAVSFVSLLVAVTAGYQVTGPDMTGQQVTGTSKSASASLS
jgi:hypothetical protein